VLDRIFVLFLPYITYGARVFCSCRNPYKGYPVKKV
jgi:hypothetical protein